MSCAYRDKKVLVTGGASFIGSHLVDSLLRKGAEVTVADDFSSGRLANLEYPLLQSGRNSWSYNNLNVKKGDLKSKQFTKTVVEDIEIIFHLAALHGGRGYIETHPAQCCSNMILDQLVFEEAIHAGVNQICFASSACVYPSYLQQSTGSEYLLKEENADPFERDKANADLEYGWAKLMGEMAIKAYHRQYGIKTSACRIFTAYGPRENETHAIIALIAKALIKMDPYVIWGNGEQDRNFTYVHDIVDGMMLVCENIDDGSALNLGRDDRITINKTIELIFEILDWLPTTIHRDLTKPQGVASRAADLTKVEKNLKWRPKTTYKEGFEKTINWYVNNKNLQEIQSNLPKLLLER